jgi:hypothetical protein
MPATLSKLPAMPKLSMPALFAKTAKAEDKGVVVEQTKQAQLLNAVITGNKEAALALVTPNKVQNKDETKLYARLTNLIKQCFDPKKASQKAHILGLIEVESAKLA